MSNNNGIIRIGNRVYLVVDGKVTIDGVEQEVNLDDFNTVSDWRGIPTDEIPIGSTAHLKARGIEISIGKFEDGYEAWAGSPAWDMRDYRGKGVTPEAAVGDFIIQLAYGIDWNSHLNPREDES